MKLQPAASKLKKKPRSFFGFRFLLQILFSNFLLTGSTITAKTQPIPGFLSAAAFKEQESTIQGHWKDVIININAPAIFTGGKTYLVFYGLPNGNSIEWTKGKKMNNGDDWHFDIQHIAAQTRYVRALDKKNNYIIVYLMARQKSWPAWKRATPGSISIIGDIVDSIAGIFKPYEPKLILNGHSGGGSFIFGFLDAVKEIPANIERIAFLDSDYGYEDSLHKQKLVTWLQQGNNNKLLVLAYNDSLVIFNGKPLVSPTGGTWYRSRLMQRGLSSFFGFSMETDTSFTKYKALKGRITILLKENPQQLIYHTEQVARNGFILSLLSATRFNKKKNFTYFGERIYEKYITD